jgi:abortive infection bacteriophage resistance protein
MSFALTTTGYYRLAGYWYPLRVQQQGGTARSDNFVAGSSFDQVVALYEFDKQLRLLVLDAVERVEIAVRTCIADQLGKHDPLAHECAHLLDARFCSDVVPGTGKTEFEHWSDRLQIAIGKSRDDFVAHHRDHYAGKMPIWVCIEVWDFGLLSRFFSGMTFRDQLHIAQRYGLPEGKFLASWLRSINLVRNIAAHHSRLWNRSIVLKPRIPANNNLLQHLTRDNFVISRVYATLCVLQYLQRIIAPTVGWSQRLQELCAQMPAAPQVALSQAGFLSDWEQLPLWRA